MASVSSSVDCSPPVLPPAVSLSPQKRNSMEKSIQVTPKRDERLPAHKSCIMEEIFQLEKVAFLETLAEQCYQIHRIANEKAAGDKDRQVGFAEVALFFGLERQRARHLINSWAKILESNGGRTAGRPRYLSPEQGDQVVEYVRKCDENRFPLTQSALLEWAQSTFSFDGSHSWLTSFLSSRDDLFLVDAEPLESARGAISEEALRKNAEVLKGKLKVAHPHLVMNCDETALDSTQETAKKVVVSTKNCPRTYVSDRGESHITFLPTVGITGWYLPVLAIIKTMSFVSDLSVRYGFPKSHWAHIVTSTSAYINDELFSYYLDEILVPGIESRRRQLGLKIDEPALLILDGCLAHSEEKLKELSQKGIDYHFLVPHSSHVTQPLDRGVFSVFKRFFKKARCYDTENKVGNRLMRGLSALTQACCPNYLRSSFWRAGFQLNYDGRDPEIVLDEGTWLTQRNSPESELKEEFFVDQAKKKKARTQTAKKGLTKAERQKMDQLERKRKKEGEKVELENPNDLKRSRTEAPSV